MTEIIRATALQHAITLYSRLDQPDGTDMVIAAAEHFEAYLKGGHVNQIVTTDVLKAANKPSKPAVTKPVTKPAAKPAAKPVEAEPEPETETATEDDGAEVEDVIQSMLKANKRHEAIALLKKFGGAKSKTGIVQQGAEVMAAFIEAANEILMAA